MTELGKGCFPSVKYVGNDTVILPLRRADMLAASSSDDISGSLKKSPRKIANEKEFFE